VLGCADGGSNTAVAARLGVNFKTVSGWRARFLRDRLGGLTDDPRPRVPRTITDAQVERAVVRTLEEVPEGATHWPERAVVVEYWAAGLTWAYGIGMIGIRVSPWLTGCW